MTQKDNKTNALIVGAGISGIRTALDLAQQNFKVTLIDKSPAMGGLLTKLDYQFPSNHCGMCKMLPLVNRDESSQFCLRKGLFHENIDLILSCELCEVSGEPGNFNVKLCRQPTWVDPELCVGCGLCENVCPKEIPDDFNEKLSSCKAIYLPIPHSIPNSYTIDPAACNQCGACEEICPVNAIQLSRSNRKEFNILVVDDELSLRDSLKEWLEQEDFSVDMAESGFDALEKLSNKTYHLMLTDIKMPKMSGVDLLVEAKKLYPDLAIVMMTAYATIETAVQAMKTGALDYLIKPFDPDTLVPMVIRIFQEIKESSDIELNVDTIILDIGTDFYNPHDEKNVFKYGIYPNVVTNMEFERLISPMGPTHGRLVRIDDNKPIKKIAWLQCVGSRDIQKNADFCSNICCMIAIKEAMLAKKLSNNTIDTSIFYMDMRTSGKTFQSYYDDAEKQFNVKFKRCKIHSLCLDKKTNKLFIRYISMKGKLQEELFDMVVLSTGQRPNRKTQNLAKICNLDLNPWGFIQPLPFSLSLSENPGIFIGGSTGGLKDISQSLILASAAAENAGEIIHSKGIIQPGNSENKEEEIYRDVSREQVKLLLIICTCNGQASKYINQDKISEKFMDNPCVDNVYYMENICTAQGWAELEQYIKDKNPNRILIGACHPYLYIKKIRELGCKINLDPVFIEVVDIMTHTLDIDTDIDLQTITQFCSNKIINTLSSGLVNLEQSQYQVSANEQNNLNPIDTTEKALVIGGGISGMNAALSIAQHGFKAIIIEKEDHLGGNLTWLKTTIEGLSYEDLLDKTIAEVEKHPLIKVFLKSKIISLTGYAPTFTTTIENNENMPVNIDHGALILATGGNEAETCSFGYTRENSDKNLIITQKEFEIKLNKKEIDPKSLKSLVMIQCVDSRKEPDNYCSKVCCPTALKQALYLKEKNPGMEIYFLYRDMMTCGFQETYFTKARNLGIIFISHGKDNLPVLEKNDKDKLIINAFEPVLNCPIEISADMAVLATGIKPELPDFLASILDIKKDRYGFFKEAESKFRPLDSIKQGIFACGIVNCPGSVLESIASANAAAERALSIIARQEIKSSNIVAMVHHSLCSLCCQCIDICPYGARMLNHDKTKILVNTTMCQGCGACAATCPNDASVLQGYSGKQIFGVIDAAFQTLI